MEEAQSIGARLRQAREHKGISQRALAIKLGVSNTAVSLWEQDRYRPANKYLVRAGYFLNVQLEEGA